jgi:hypothetical protein
VRPADDQHTLPSIRKLAPKPMLNLADAILLYCLYPVFDREGFTKEQATTNDTFVQRYYFWRSRLTCISGPH